MATDPRRAIPSTDVVLSDPRVRTAMTRLGGHTVKQIIAGVMAEARVGTIGPADVTKTVVARLPEAATTLRPVLNATGVIVHTNLGRAPLSSAAIDALLRSAGYVDIEYDVERGERCTRGRGLLDALQSAVSGAESVHVVNNGAAAAALVAAALGNGREIVVSRGELIEIGDGFRLPDLLEATGSRLREVGTTNRTIMEDYRTAIGPDTGFVLKVHTSNFVVKGFTASVSVRELATLGPPVVVDVGSGLLHSEPVLPSEPDVSTMLRDGAALVTASADKLLGGPQAGLVFGRRELVAMVRQHPLARAMRVDKLRLAALEATLRGPLPPVGQALHADTLELRARCEAIAHEACASNIAAMVVPSDGLVGGGGAPNVALPGWAVALPIEYGDDLRRGDPCIVARLENGRCLLDVRCVPPEMDDTIVKALRAARSRLAD